MNVKRKSESESKKCRHNQDNKEEKKENIFTCKLLIKKENIEASEKKTKRLLRK